MEKTILFIGGSKGIGFETVKLLHDTHNVIVASRSQGELSETKAKHLNFDAFQDDINTLDLPDNLDGLVYCPGTINLKPFNRLKTDDFVEDLQKNFLSLIRITKELLPKLKKGHHPSIVYFSTVAVQLGMPFHTSVAASKGAIEGFTRALAAENAPTLRVNAIAPSLTHTGLSDKMLNNEKKLESMNERHPLKRIGKPSDIAAMVKFLLSEDSSWITGQIMKVDGGLSSVKL